MLRKLPRVATSQNPKDNNDLGMCSVENITQLFRRDAFINPLLNSIHLTKLPKGYTCCWVMRLIQRTLSYL